MSSSECIIKYTHRYDPVFGSAREFNIDTVEVLLYMIQDGHLDRNADMEDIISLLDEWDA